ncbi:MAG: IS110 family transposase [Micromonosporaceae bacterium]
MAFEAAFGWGWLVQLLEDYCFDPHLVHPLRCKAIASARLKNDKVDAAILAQLLRADLLPEAWIAPPQVRQLRALLRHRASLVRLGTGLRNRIHAVAADHGYDRSASYWTGPGRGWLAELDLPPASREIVTDSLAVIDGLAPVIERLDGELHQHAKADPRVKVLRTLPVGEFTALVMVAEIGDISRFPSARSGGVPKVASSSWTAARPPSGRGSRPDATTTSARRLVSSRSNTLTEPADRRPLRRTLMPRTANAWSCQRAVVRRMDLSASRRARSHRPRAVGVTSPATGYSGRRQRPGAVLSEARFRR